MKRPGNIDDPYAEREAQKYVRPIPSREFILQALADHQGPMDFDTLAGALDVVEPVDVESLNRRLTAMERGGQILRNRRGAFLPVGRNDLIRGRVIGHPDGFGFLAPDEGGEDLFLSPREMRALMHGDKAVVRVVGRDRRGRREGALVEVLERNNRQVVGRFFIERGIGFVVPDNKRLHQELLIPTDQIGGTAAGHIVIAEILQQPSRHSQPIGRIVEVLGEHMAPGMEIDIAIRSHELPFEWPEEVLADAAQFAPRVTEKAKQGRLDLREMPLVTIDGEDAKDFDDAVYCEPTGKGWLLRVAIADVSSYVPLESPLDKEAEKRGTSVYFPGRVIPMLPEALSNGLCSLNPDEERLCLVCTLDIDHKGKIVDYRFDEAVMRSHARLTYTGVAAMTVERKPDARRKNPELMRHLDDLYDLYRTLHKARMRRGAIDFDTLETQIVFGEGRKIERIVPARRNDAHRIIEECMIAANVAAARFLQTNKIPTLYRIHERPNEDRLEDLRSFLSELGLKLPGGKEPKAGDYAELMREISARSDAHLIQTVLLRSLMQAVYSPDNGPDNGGHFGLSLEAYAHFTSPIRRYPDLLVHRAIRHCLRGRKPSNFEYSHNDMVALGEHCSMTERRADDATRDAIDWLKCEYMQDKVGKEFDGVISAVTAFGVFVELNDIYVEGLAHVTSLPNDYYRFDSISHVLRGERSGRVYRLGDAIKVKLMRVDLDERKIDFDPVDSKAHGSGHLRRSKKKKK